MTRRPWTIQDRTKLREAHAANTPFAAIARLLGRSETACRQRALRLGLYRTHEYRRYGPAFERVLREKHAQGWSDAEIADASGGERHAVGEHRRRLGLPSNAYNPRHLRKLAPTQYKRGCLRGQAARNWKAAGAITIRNDKSGKRFRWIKMRDDGPPQKRWVPYARQVWAQSQGSIPPGWFVIHADGNTLNDHIRNLRLVTRRGHLSIQRQRDPGMDVRSLRARVAATRKRHAHARLVREAARRQMAAKLEACA